MTSPTLLGWICASWLGGPRNERLQLGPIDDPIRRRAPPTPADTPSATGPHAHVDTRQLPASRPVEEIHVNCPHAMYARRVDKPAIKNVTGQGYVVVPPYRSPHHSCIGSQADFGLSQRHVRLSYDRKGVARSEEHPGYRRVVAAGVAAHDDVADPPDSRIPGVADRAAKNLGERDHPVGDSRTKSKVPA
jgi:hypothetical protein